MTHRRCHFGGGWVAFALAVAVTPVDEGSLPVTNGAIYRPTGRSRECTLGEEEKGKERREREEGERERKEREREREKKDACYCPVTESLDRRGGKGSMVDSRCFFYLVNADMNADKSQLMNFPARFIFQICSLCFM